MKLHIVVEGPFEQQLLRWLLHEEISEFNGLIRFWEGGGKSSAESLARTIAAADSEPVVLVEDADAVDPGKSAERIQFLNWYFGQVVPRKQWDVVLMRPAIEGLLFRDVRVLGEALERAQPLRESGRVRAEYDPARVLDTLLAEAGLDRNELVARLCNRFREADDAFSTAPEIQSLKNFIRRHLAHAHAA